MKGSTITAAIAVIAVATLLATTATQAVYKCQVNGETVFSQTPCAPDAKEIEVKVHRPNAEDVQRTEEHTKWMRGHTEAANIQREIAETEREIDTYNRNMELELGILRDKKANAANNLAGATWEQSISTEMQAVVDKYKAKIAMGRERITRLQERLEQLTK